MARIRRQPVGQRTASRSRSDDDKIVLQISLPIRPKNETFYLDKEPSCVYDTGARRNASGWTVFSPLAAQVVLQ
jgi:hypothetical protein